VAEQLQHGINLIQPQRAFSLLQLAHKPQAHARLGRQVGLRKPQQPAALFYKSGQWVENGEYPNGYN